MSRLVFTLFCNSCHQCCISQQGYVAINHYNNRRRKLSEVLVTTVFVDTRLWKTETRGHVSEISVNHTRYRQIGSKSTNRSPLACRKEGQKVTVVAVIGGFRSDLSITRETDGNFGNVSAGVLFSKVAYQRKRW